MIGRRGRKAVAAVLALSLLSGGVVAYRHFKKPSAASPALPPDIPETIVEVEVRTTLEAARQRVLNEPRSVRAWGDFGLLCRAHELFPEAIACFRTAAQLDPASPQWPYLLGAVNVLIDPDAALTNFRTAYRLAVQPDERSAVRQQLAEVLLERNELDEAMQLYEDGLREDPQDAPCRHGLGVIAYRRGNLAEAAEHLRAGADSPYVRKKTAALLTTISRQLGRVDDAQRFEAQAAQAPIDEPWPNPFDQGYEDAQVGPAARHRLVKELLAHGQHQAVVNAMRETALSSGNGTDELLLGVSTGALGDWASAEKIFRMTVARNPNYATGRCYLGIALYFQADPFGKERNRTPDAKMLESALAEFRKAMELKPDLGEAHLYAAYCLKLLNRPEEAVRECTLAIQVMPHSSDAHFTLGEMLHQQGKSAEAVPHLENAARLAPTHDTRARDLLQQIRSRKP